MALVLVVETGSGLTNANSYASVAEADSYHEAHLYASVWFAMTVPEKNAALVWGTRLLDEQVDWPGARSTIGQALRWPRVGVPDRDAIGDMVLSDPVLYGSFIAGDIIPLWLKYATAELGRQLKAADRTADVETLGFSQLTVGSIGLSIDKHDRRNLLPDSVISMVQPYGSVRRAGGSSVIQLQRV